MVYLVSPFGLRDTKTLPSSLNATELLLAALCTLVSLCTRDVVTTTAFAKCWCCLANHSAVHRPSQTNTPPSHPSTPLRLHHPPLHPPAPHIRSVCHHQIYKHRWVVMTTVSDREASSTLQSARPFTCYWPKGCPKVSRRFPSQRFSLPPTSKYSFSSTVQQSNC